LHTTLADGSRARRSGYVMQADSLESDGGFARKGLLVQPWIALLGYTLSSRVWQDKSLIEIVEDVFADHASVAAWKWDDDVRKACLLATAVSARIAFNTAKAIWIS